MKDRVAGSLERVMCTSARVTAEAALAERAHGVTEMRQVKHYYHRGIQARVGIER